MAVETDKDSIEIIDFSQLQQSLCENLAGMPELRRRKTSLKEHVPDAHLAHHRHTVWFFQIHGLLKTFFREHV
jgi:hypothetical protein